MSYSPRQQRIFNQLYDKLQTLRFTKVSDKEEAARLISDIVRDIDLVVDGELSLKVKNKEVK